MKSRVNRNMYIPSITMLIAILNVCLIPFGNVESFTLSQQRTITSSSANYCRYQDRSNFIVTTTGSAKNHQPHWNKLFLKNRQQQYAIYSNNNNNNSDLDSENNFNNKIGGRLDTTDTIEVIDSSISSSPQTRLPPKYICDMDNTTQQLAFIMSFVLLGFGTSICIQLWYNIVLPIFGNEYFVQIQTIIFPILFGIIFTLVGIGHFIFVQNFVRIVPPYNTWGGLWKIPAPFHTQMNISYEEYHSYWTGIVEFLGGLWLLYNSLNHINTDPSLPAILLFLLTIIVTPANIYMFTHNASPGGKIPPLSYPYGHLFRFVLQCGLLSNFYIMIHPLSI